MTVPSSAQHPESRPTGARRGTRRPAPGASIVALIVILAIVATIVSVVIRLDNQPNIATDQVEQAEILAHSVAPERLAISPVTEAEHFTPEWYAWYKASLAGTPATVWPTYTDRYWDLAEQSGVTFPTTTNRDYTYFTERYWQLAEAHAQANVKTESVLPGTATDGDYAYYTERYWKMAQSQPAVIVAPEQEWSYYTERYWALSKENGN